MTSDIFARRVVCTKMPIDKLCMIFYEQIDVQILN